MNFYILRNSFGQYYWNLKAANNEIVAQSETYISKQAAINAIHAIQAGAASAIVCDSTGEG